MSHSDLSTPTIATAPVHPPHSDDNAANPPQLRSSSSSPANSRPSESPAFPLASQSSLVHPRSDSNSIASSSSGSGRLEEFDSGSSDVEIYLDGLDLDASYAGHVPLGAQERSFSSAIRSGTTFGNGSESQMATVKIKSENSCVLPVSYVDSLSTAPKTHTATDLMPKNESPSIDKLSREARLPLDVAARPPSSRNPSSMYTSDALPQAQPQYNVSIQNKFPEHVISCSNKHSQTGTLLQSQSSTEAQLQISLDSIPPILIPAQLPSSATVPSFPPMLMPRAPAQSTIPLPDMTEGGHVEEAREYKGADRLEDVGNGDAFQPNRHIAGAGSYKNDELDARLPLRACYDGQEQEVSTQVQNFHSHSQAEVCCNLPTHGVHDNAGLGTQSHQFYDLSRLKTGNAPHAGLFDAHQANFIAAQRVYNACPKTPNVYINGLPPHFPEDQLFALAAPFGEVRSVRTFTRHVRESESGYGFVLFETVDAAERCIASLRRYRNLHPTFSKQIHKIPGTMYAHGPPRPTGTDVSATSKDDWDQENYGGWYRGDASFKAKMESLHDQTSTNLYMEGLPLSIDEPTLAALVSPHRIKSSRFFQTRLSNPPRIIAFVRLETRAGAEEIIERLHGRMVRGWNDTGSRISVRFADTSEQRELRRAERSTKEGDEQSPARLTIAQAALLNLRGGQELLAKTATSASGLQDKQQQRTHIPVIGSCGRGAEAGNLSTMTGGHRQGVRVDDFQSNATCVEPRLAHLAVHGTLPPPLAQSESLPLVSSSATRHAYPTSSSPGFTVDYSGRHYTRTPVVLDSRIGSAQHSTTMSRLHPSVHDSTSTHQLSIPYASPLKIDPATDLLQSLRCQAQIPRRGTKLSPNEYIRETGRIPDGSCGWEGLNVVEENSARDHAYLHDLYACGIVNNTFSNGHPAHGGAVFAEYPAATHQSSTAQAHAGYTATEAYIMRAHAESNALQRRGTLPVDLARRRREAGNLGVDIGVGVRGHRAQATAVSLGSRQRCPVLSSGALALSNHEDDLHLVRNDSKPHRCQDPGPGRDAAERLGCDHYPTRLPLSHDSASRDDGNVGQGQQQQQYQQQHPQQHYSSSLDISNAQHYQQAHLRSTTLPHRSSTNSHQHQRHYQHSSMSIPTSTGIRTPQHASVPVMNKNVDMGGVCENEHYTDPAVFAKNSRNNSNSNSNSAGPSPGHCNLINNSDQRNHTSDSNYSNNSNINGNYSRSNNGNICNVTKTGRALSARPSGNYDSKAHYQRGGIAGYQEGNTYESEASPPLISPTLTYSSQTPSTLSPATPFFGSFIHQAEGFNGSGEVGIAEGKGGKVSHGVARAEG